MGREKPEPTSFTVIRADNSIGRCGLLLVVVASLVVIAYIFFAVANTGAL